MPSGLTDLTKAIYTTTEEQKINDTRLGLSACLVVAEQLKEVPSELAVRERSRDRGPRRDPGPVRAEDRVRGFDQQSCSPSRPAVMITAHVPAVRLPPDHAGGLMAAAVPA
jgi:hypothetical protein